jgi:hypothetical protein
MDTTHAATITSHIHLAQVLEGAQALLDTMRATGCANGVGYYPREIIAQERRVARLQDMLDSIECPSL